MKKLFYIRKKKYDFKMYMIKDRQIERKREDKKRIFQDNF